MEKQFYFPRPLKLHSIKSQSRMQSFNLEFISSPMKLDKFKKTQNIYLSKEKETDLKEANQRLKFQINNKNQELLLLRTELAQLKEENKKVKDYVYNVEIYKQQNSQYSQILYLQDTLKQKEKLNRDLVQQVDAQQKETKYTQLQEIKIQNQEVLQENKRLRSFLIQVINQQEQSMIPVIQETTDNLLTQMKNFEDQQKDYKFINFNQKQYEEDLKKLRRENIILKNQIKTHNAKMNDLGQDSKNLYKNKILKQKEENLKQLNSKIQKLQTQKRDLEQENFLQKTDIKEFQVKVKFLKDLPHVYEDLTQKHLQLRQYLTRLKENLNSKDEFIVKLQNRSKLTSQAQSQKQLHKSKPSSETLISQSIPFLENDPQFAVSQELAAVAKRLHYSLLIKKIPYDNIDLYIHRNKIEKQIDYSSIQNILQQEPFNLTPQEVDIFFDYISKYESYSSAIPIEEQMIEGQIFIMVFKHLIRRYEIFTKKESEEILLQLAKAIWHRRIDLQSHCIERARFEDEQKYYVRNQFLLSDVVNFMNLSSQENQFIFEFSFENSGQVEILDYCEFLDFVISIKIKSDPLIMKLKNKMIKLKQNQNPRLAKLLSQAPKYISKNWKNMQKNFMIAKKKMEQQNELDDDENEKYYSKKNSPYLQENQDFDQEIQENQEYCENQEEEQKTTQMQEINEKQEQKQEQLQEENQKNLEQLEENLENQENYENQVKQEKIQEMDPHQRQSTLDRNQKQEINEHQPTSRLNSAQANHLRDKPTLHKISDQEKPQAPFTEDKVLRKSNTLKKESNSSDNLNDIIGHSKCSSNHQKPRESQKIQVDSFQ